MPYRQVCHEHCPKGGGSGAALAILVLIIVVIAAAARPVEHAASTMLRIAVEVLEIAGIVVGSAAVLGVAGWAASAALHARQRRAIETAPGSQYQVTLTPHVQTISAPPRAIEAPKTALTGITSTAAKYSNVEEKN